jgi:excinuclease UvrABC ATPase subunit
MTAMDTRTGTVEGLRASDTLTGRHFHDRAALKETVRTPTGTLEICGATAHNLRDVDVDVDIPLDVRAARAATGPRTKGR